MAGQQKRGFRLPWGNGAPEGGAGAATLEPGPDAAGDAVHDDLGDGPFGLTDAAALTTDAAPAASDAIDTGAEAAMIDTESPTLEAKTEGAAPNRSAWPDTDNAVASRQARGSDDVTARPPIHAQGESRVPRRDNPLVAGLVKAMREAALASRAETTNRLDSEAKARIETIRSRATSEVAELRKRADDDVLSIREWSKAEVARIKQETDNRIEARKAELEGETERHGVSVTRLVDEVENVVLSFETEMDTFFERLLAESDPARLATLAEQAPEPPDLSGDGPAALDLVFEAPEATAADAHATTAADTAPTVDHPLGADAAAEAEAEATEGLDMGSSTEWPAAALAAVRRTDAPAMDSTGPGQTRLLVSGLTSVAGISAFKGALGQLDGVHNVSVSSGERGVFVFAVNHEPDADLAAGIAGIQGFAARITDATDDGVNVVAHEPAA
jgi:hypothetical protein